MTSHRKFRLASTALLLLLAACGGGGGSNDEPNPPAASVPGVPAAPAATAGASSATVTWSAPSTGGSPILNYTVTAQPGGAEAVVNGSTTTVLVTGLTNGTSYTFTVFATNSVGDGPSSLASAPVTPVAVVSNGFPVVAAPNGRYLEDSGGTPFPILGRTAWFVISLASADYQMFIDDSVARGYNAIEMHVVDHDARGNHPPYDGDGNLPFLKRLDGATWDGSLTYANSANEAPDFTTPNPAYWNGVDTFLAFCESRGVLVLMFPAYTGYLGGEQGWMAEMAANGAARMQAYGAWIASRYASQKNLVWMLGGDMASFTQEQEDAESGLLAGLQSVVPQQSLNYSAEWLRHSIATDQSPFGSSMTLNGVYAGSTDISSLAQSAYMHSPVLPAYLLEEPYDEEGADGNGVNSDATQPVRRFQWWGVLGTVGGYVSGNGYVWPFTGDWKGHLDTQGSRDMARLNAFVQSIRWWELVPSGLDGMKTLVTSGGGALGDSNYVASAASASGNLLVAYVPPDHAGDISVDMTAMSGTAMARWFNPTTGAYTDIGVFADTGTQTFSPPGNNGTGYSDWVLSIVKQ